MSLPLIDFKEANNWVKRYKDDILGCTDDASGPRGIRTVDWVPMDVYGKYSFMEFRETADGGRSVGQSFPVFVGFLRAMNQYGLCAAINVTRGITDYPEEMPAVFYLRFMMETCTSVKGEKSVETFVQENSPLGPFNLSVLDKKNAAGIHFYQNEDRSHHVRWWQSGNELVTLNFRYGEKGESNPTPSNSAARKFEIESYYKQLREEGRFNSIDSSERLKEVLKGPEVNNIRTISSAYFDPSNQIFEISFDNGYASDRPLLQIPLNQWF